MARRKQAEAENLKLALGMAEESVKRLEGERLHKELLDAEASGHAVELGVARKQAEAECGRAHGAP